MSLNCVANRYAATYVKDGQPYRDLFKAYGIRFLIKSTGKAGKFSIVPLLLNVGSGVGLLAVVSFSSFPQDVFRIIFVFPARRLRSKVPIQCQRTQPSLPRTCTNSYFV